jgi:GAF domain-containing protein
MVLDRHAHLLFRYPERYFTFPGEVESPLVEVLLTPFYNEGQPVGSIWIIAHDETKTFDACDVQIVTELGRFASSAHALLTSLGYVQVPGHPAGPVRSR